MNDKTGDVYMVESPTYYRAFQPILKTLQKMDIEELCFSEELVRTKVGPLPAFLEPSKWYQVDISNIFIVYSHSL